MSNADIDIMRSCSRRRRHARQRMRKVSSDDLQSFSTASTRFDFPRMQETRRHWQALLFWLSCESELEKSGLTEVTQADRQHDLELGDLMLTVFNRHFDVPTLPSDVDVFALALELSDRVYARSVHQHGLITPRMAEEGMRVFDAYVGLYLPAYLPKRASSQASQLPH